MTDKYRLQMLVALFAGILLLLNTSSAQAQSGGDYELGWSTIDGGGEEMTGGVYDMAGTVAQTETNTMSGGDYSLGGGVWGGGANPVVSGLYLPTILR